MHRVHTRYWSRLGGIALLVPLLLGALVVHQAHTLQGAAASSFKHSGQLKVGPTTRAGHPSVVDLTHLPPSNLKVGDFQNRA